MKEKIIGVYKITNLINNKVYIGSSNNCLNRWNIHLWKGSKQVISRAIKKYGKENFKFEIIEKCDLQSLRSRELYWITFYNSCDTTKGYNIAKDTENANLGRKMSEEQKKKLSDKAKLRTGDKNSFFGKHHSNTTRQQMSETKKAKYRGKDNPNYGNKYSIEIRKKISLSQLGSKRAAKKVLQIDPITNDVIKVWDSATDASLALAGKKSNHIGCVCRGNLNQTLGYKWKFA